MQFSDFSFLFLFLPAGFILLIVFAAILAAGTLHEGSDLHFIRTEYKNCWLGEQGRLLTQAVTGLDDYVKLEPAYDTLYTGTIRNTGETGTGSFTDIFIDTGIYEATGPYDGVTSWHYAYGVDGPAHNENASYGNVLVVADSFQQCMGPFLTLGIKDLEVCDIRTWESGALLEKIENGAYDTVLVIYSEIMIGAHSDPANYNRNTFSFFPD